MQAKIKKHIKKFTKKQKNRAKPIIIIIKSVGLLEIRKTEFSTIPY